MERITIDNLDKTIEKNFEIEAEVREQIKYMEKYLKKYRIHSPEKLAFQILKENNLIRLPIPDSDWGGAIYELPNGCKIPIINTAQPRLYQFFICWHEVYHLTEESFKNNDTHFISTRDLYLSERKADYFASQMLIGEDVYKYYHQLKNEHELFIDRIACCMDVFKAPYKAILIQLYEIAKRFDDLVLQETVKKNFDFDLDSKQWEEKFNELLLDDTLVKPTYIVDFSELKRKIIKMSKQNDDVELFLDNKEFLLSLEKKFHKIKDEAIE